MTGTCRVSRGFSLIELLVSMVIGLFLLGGLVMVMANSKQHYAQQDYSARLQESGRFAMQFLSYDIRMAGYFGCSNALQNEPSDIGLGDEDYLDTRGNDALSDSITIVYAEPTPPAQEVFVQALADPAAQANVYTVDADKLPTDWEAGTHAIIADCGGASLARIIDITDDKVTLGTETDPGQTGKTPLQTEALLGRFYDPSNVDSGPITIRRLIRREYSVDVSGTSGIPVLLRDEDPSDANPGLEIVEGVENLQFLYQILNGTSFQTATSAGPLAAVQLGVLVRSVSNEDLDDREFGSGADITVDDGGLDGAHPVVDQDVAVQPLRGQRRVFSNTLAIRNLPL